MSDVAPPEEQASPTPPPSSSPAQDTWLKQALGLDAPAYGNAAGGRSGRGKNRARKLKAKKPVPRASLGPAQTTRAAKLLADMSPDDREKVETMLNSAKPVEKQYLEKALACKHTAAELSKFYTQIAGKDAKWMEMNLHVVGEPGGKGIKQQWRDSCGPTTIQAMMGELDPLYALKLRTENPWLDSADDDSGTTVNPKAAAEQKSILEKHGGKAVARTSTENDKDASGKNRQYGMVLQDALNEKTATTGLKFDPKWIDPAKVDESLTELDTCLASGLPVPLRLGDANGGHFVLMTGEDPGPPRRYSIHDPWAGETIIVTDKQIKTNKFKIAGYSVITHFFKPGAAMPKQPPKPKKTP